MKTITKKIIILLTTISMLLSLSGCALFTPKDPFKGISVNNEERSWKNDDEKYAELLKSYGDTRCHGTFALATDDDIVYLYCEDALEKDGTTPVSPYTKFDI